MDNLSLLLENAHPDVQLTEKEHQLLVTLHSGSGSRVELLQKVWNFTDTFAAKVTYKDTRSVDMTVSRLKKKVAAVGVEIKSVRGVGYRLI